MSSMSKKVVRRTLVLLGVAVVSGVLAYVVNHDKTAPASSVVPRQPVDGQPFRPAHPDFDLEEFAACLRAHGGDLRGAFLACRRYLPDRAFGRGRGVGPREGPMPLLPTT
jgi:hypothetical protein